MATMVKEKRKEKKKTKDKSASRGCAEVEQPSISGEPVDSKVTVSISITSENVSEKSSHMSEQLKDLSEETSPCNISGLESIESKSFESSSILDLSSSFNLSLVEETNIEDQKAVASTLDMPVSQSPSVIDHTTAGNTYQNLSSKLERICIPQLDPNINLEDLRNRLENPQAYWKTEKESQSLVKTETDRNSANVEQIMENVVPSAPVFEECQEPQAVILRQEVVKEARQKLQHVPPEETVMQFGEKEMAEIRAMSEREEAIVEAGPMCGPDHPLVDLLSTFRSSITAVERERIKLSKAMTDEEKYRKGLWKIDKKTVNISETCPCGASISFKASYEHAELLKHLLPVARLKLEGVSRDIKESYCHHQYMALVTYYQIEEVVSEVIKSSKEEVRAALALVLQALRLSDAAPVTAAALERWARALGAALLRDASDHCHLLHLLHHLFRQTRSVRWAASIIRISVTDTSSAAQALALLDLLLTKQRVEAAVECVELEDVESEAGWEEVDERGGGCGVSARSLREHDLLALLRAFPWRRLLASLLLFTHQDVSKARDCDVEADTLGRRISTACGGVRALLAVLARAVTSHPHYARLRGRLRALARRALHALAGLHAHCMDHYLPEVKGRVSAETEAVFVAGLALLLPDLLHELPATLLRDDSARDYCLAFIQGLHDKSPKAGATQWAQWAQWAEGCGPRVVTVAHAAALRRRDSTLATTVLDFLIQTGIKKKSVPCKGQCESTAKEQIPLLLASHSYLYTTAFHKLADLGQVEQLEPSSVDPLSPDSWRPSPAEMAGVLEDWSKRCPNLIQHLLMKLDYTPHTGVSLDTQLTIGSWLCAMSRETPPCPEWAWTVLRKLNVHRSSWSLPLDAPSPEPEPSDLLSTAFAVLSSSWGHCVPLMCSAGVSGVARLAAARPSDAVHCLAPVMLLMSHSPESVSLTPGFTELFNLLLRSGPTMVQRALGLGPVPGSELLTRLMIKQIETNYPGFSKPAVLSAWLHALWRAGGAAPQQLETVLLAARQWQLFDRHVTMLLQEKNSSEYLTSVVRSAYSAPLVCEVTLRGAHWLRELQTGLWPRLLDVLHLQRQSQARIHVDNALKQIGANMAADELVIYRAAAAIAAALLDHPALLMLFRLFLYLYQQRPPLSMHESTAPIGPLFFSGLLKSRQLAHVHKKLQDARAYHKNEVDQEDNSESSSESSVRRTNETRAPQEVEILPKLKFEDFTQEGTDKNPVTSKAPGQTEVDPSLSFEEDDRAIKLSYNENAFTFLSRCQQVLLDDKNLLKASPPDVSAYISDTSLSAAWDRELAIRRPPPLHDEITTAKSKDHTRQEASSNEGPSNETLSLKTPFAITIASLMKVEENENPSQNIDIDMQKELEITSLLAGKDLKSEKEILSVVNECLLEFQNDAVEWSRDVDRLSSLDGALWALVTSLRVCRPLPPVRRQCPQKCKPLTIHVPHQEWCISTGAEQGIVENRRSAQITIKRMARPRPNLARKAAILIAVVKYIKSVWTARDVLRMAWKATNSTRSSSASAHTAITTLVQMLAERWVRVDGELCVKFLSCWCKEAASPLQQSLCGLLVPPAAQCWWPQAYLAVLNGSLPSHTCFSFLSKFEMGRWSQTMPPQNRIELVRALTVAAQRWGPTPDAEHHVLLELIGVHWALVAHDSCVCACACACAGASAARCLPPALWPHITRAAAAAAAAERITHHQLGHLLRELGVIWWEARSGPGSSQPSVPYSVYAPHFAELLCVLVRAFVASAVAMSYTPERVAQYAWSALQESWGPWVSPHAAMAPLLPSVEIQGATEAYTTMLKHYVDNIHQIMLDCPGTEPSLLQLQFEWTVQTYMSVKSATSQECRVQMSALLTATQSLPWTEHQWMRPSCLQLAVQSCGEAELAAWCASAWRSVTAEGWLASVAHQQMAPHLASLLYLFTAVPHHPQTLEEASRLPWSRLPEAALEEAMERFFVQYHNPAVPYHELPQFRVLLSAGELTPSPASAASAASAVSAASVSKRGVCVSVWSRAAAQPALSAHLASYARAILRTLTDLAPFIEESEGEIEALLSRAVTIMCLEPAAASVLPVWREWAVAASYRLRCACASGAAALTAFECFASLGDTALRALMAHTDSRGWPEILSRWSSCHWTDPTPLVARTKLHAAYAVANAHPQNSTALRTIILALLVASVNFVENEAIVALWICYAARIAVSSVGEGSERESRAAARSLLVRYGEEPRRSLLKVVTMQQDTSQCTAHHRLLARLALCIIENTASNKTAFEAASAAVLGSTSEVVSWGANPTPKKLPRLAMRLFPKYDNYFQIELDLAEE